MSLPQNIDNEIREIFANPRERIQQNEWELREFLSRVIAGLKPALTVELGSWRGTNAALLSLVTSGQTFSFDIQDYGDKDKALQIARRNNAHLEFKMMNARLAATAAQFKPESIDLLFIDDGHRIEEVTEEYAVWVPYVKKGGWIAFHDVNPGANQCAPGVHPDICQSHVFWSNLPGPKEEIIFPDNPASPGIGIIRK